MDCIKLGERVRSARKRKGLTQAQLAEVTGYSTQHISHIETGMTKLSIDCIVTLANELDVSLDYLLVDSLEKREQGMLEERFGALLKVYNEEEKELVYNINLSMKDSLLRYCEMIGEKKSDTRDN
ncbi:MAG: helix-turn-helix transcriptional regulator [Eubacteriales bacterium]|nr:helix-turn-helix transcriptional regulator [Eubacteriales bacterium]